MIDTFTLLEKAKSSAFYLRLLNVGLGKMIPFNKPHRMKIVEITEDQIKIRLPYVKRNLNHLRGMHACALATVSELACGMFLLTKLDQRKYRIIMKRMEMDYFYQGRMEVEVVFSLTDDWLQQHIFQPLVTAEAVEIMCEVLTHDVQGNHLTTGKVFWQIKDWQKVKTKPK